MAELGTPPRVAAIMITGNVVSGSPGRAIFERALQSVAWADEMIVVDSDSRDGTREVARRYTDRIYVHPYRNSLKQQKKIALEYVTCEWVLWLDADEVLPPALIAEIQQALRAPAAQGYEIIRQHFFAGRLLRHAGEDAKPRLWRRGVGAWAGTENDDYYTVPPPVARFRTPMEHYSTASLRLRLQKMAYFAPAHAALAKLPPRSDYGLADVWRRLLRPPLQRLYGVYWVERGYKDGVRGLIWALLCAISEFYTAILVWERAQPEMAAEATRTRSAGEAD